MKKKQRGWPAGWPVFISLYTAVRRRGKPIEEKLWTGNITPAQHGNKKNRLAVDSPIPRCDVLLLLQNKKEKRNENRFMILLLLSPQSSVRVFPADHYYYFFMAGQGERTSRHMKNSDGRLGLFPTCSPLRFHAQKWTTSNKTPALFENSSMTPTTTTTKMKINKQT